MNIYAMEYVWLHFIKGKPIVKKPCGRRLWIWVFVGSGAKPIVNACCMGI
jgi:hypothetical protein